MSSCDWLIFIPAFSCTAWRHTWDHHLSLWRSIHTTVGCNVDVISYLTFIRRKYSCIFLIHSAKLTKQWIIIKRLQHDLEVLLGVIQPARFSSSSVSCKESATNFHVHVPYLTLIGSTDWHKLSVTVTQRGSGVIHFSQYGVIFSAYRLQRNKKTTTKKTKTHQSLVNNAV